MSFFQAVVLGLVQGLTEFLPISSSGHLVLFSKLPWWTEQPLVFDTTLHLATALALIIYFYKDLLVIVGAFLRDFPLVKADFGRYSNQSRVFINIVVGSIPAAVLGFLFEETFETKFRSVTSVAIFLFLGALLMVAAQKRSKSSNTIENITTVQSLTIGSFQALALFPGVSRSGATLSGALMQNLTRYDAAKFSFLLSIPIVLLAGLYKLVTTDWAISTVPIGVLAMGFLTSLLSGLAVVHFLLNYLRTKNLNVFIWYRALLAIALLLFVR